MDKEKLLERKLVDRVKKLGGWAVKFWAVNLTGFPDRLVLMPIGKISFVEVKSEGKKPSPRQVVVHGLLRKLGFNVFVIDTQILLEEYLNEIQIKNVS